MSDCPLVQDNISLRKKLVIFAMLSFIRDSWGTTFSYFSYKAYFNQFLFLSLSNEWKLYHNFTYHSLAN